MRVMQIFYSLIRAPRFSISMMLTLGLGLAVTMLMWAVLWHAVLEPLPYRDAGALSVLSALRDGQTSGPLFALTGLSLLVLLEAATNAAHLVLTPGRQRAAACLVMDALGASRGDLARVMLLETVLLATFAAGLAVLMGWALWKLSPDLSDSGLAIDPELGFGLIMNPKLALGAVLLCLFSILLAGGKV